MYFRVVKGSRGYLCSVTCLKGQTLKHTTCGCKILLLSPQAWPSPHLVREDCIWPPGWPRQAGDRARQDLPAPAAGSRGHAGCHCSDGNAAVHQQRAAQSGRAFHHPLRSPHRSSVRWWKGSSKGQGDCCRDLNSGRLKASFQSREGIFLFYLFFSRTATKSGMMAG